MANDTGRPVHLCLKRPQFPNAESNVQYGHQSERHLLQNRFSRNHEDKKGYEL